jgi:hypothetical protein
MKLHTRLTDSDISYLIVVGASLLLGSALQPANALVCSSADQMPSLSELLLQADLAYPISRAS